MPRSTAGAITLAEEQPVSRGRLMVRRLFVLGVAVAVGIAGWLGVRHVMALVSGPECRVTDNGTTFSWATDQASNAAVITAISNRRGLPARAATIALATAMQESKVRNITYGDRDSVGLFQQRPSQGWGTVAQIMNPEYATNAFLDALVKVKNWQNLEVTVAAQSVQRSAAGQAYAQHEEQARITASVLSGYAPGGLGCALADPQAPGTAAALVALVKDDHGMPAKVVTTADGASTVTVTAKDARQAWAIGSWAVARAVTTGAVAVEVAGKEWRRGLEESAFAWHDVGSAGTGTDPLTVTITL